MTACFIDSVDVGHEATTLLELLSHRAAHQPDRLAYTFLQDGEIEAGCFTYLQLEQQAKAIAARLQSVCPAGSRALLLYPPGLEFIAAFMGCLYAGMVAVPAYPPRRNQSLNRLQAIVTDAQAAVALTTTALLDDVQERFAEPGLAQMNWIASDAIDPDAANQWQQPDVNGDTLAFLQYTSGSTGTPKGVMISHGNLLHNSNLIRQSFADTPESRGVSWLPPYHDMGLIGGILQPLYVGAPMVLMPPIAFLQKPLRWLQAVSHYKATTSGAPNFAYDLCAQKITPEQRDRLDLSHWQVAFTGAEPVRADTIEQFAAFFAPCGFRREAFHPCYGMAETTLMVSGSLRGVPPVIYHADAAALEQHRVVAANAGQEGTRAIVGCGQGWLDQQIQIVDPATLTQCAANQVGEIWVSGTSVAQGYWNQPDLTQKTFHAAIASADFLRTGDLGFLQDGELFVTGRIKDVIIIRGQNHYPQDIERTVEESHPALRSGCGAAFTVEVKGQERLVIVQEVERQYLRKFNVKEAVGSISQAVAAQHGLQAYATVFVKTGSIPKTSSGKIQRFACRAGFLAGSLNVVEDWSEQPQGKAKFLHLQTEVESLLKELSTGKSI